MNTNMTITCETCEQDIDCRIGYSNRRIQPLSFSCPHCGSQIGITLDISDAPRSMFSYDGCAPSKTQPTGAFEGHNPFIDLHLDFPVRFGEYKMGRTPWLMAMEDLRKAVGGDGEKAHTMSQSLSIKLNALNDLYEKADDIKRLVNLYHGKNKQLFQKRAANFMGQPEVTSLLPQDINATLYTVISKAFFPFTVLSEGREISVEMPKLLQTLDKEQLDTFIKEVDDSSFLSSLQRDCLKIYPRIFDAELPLRPALFLDLTGGTESASLATRVSTQDFSGLKDLYKDIVEVLGRQLVLVAGINNLVHRDNANSFKVIDGGALSNLEKFSSKTLSDKLKYLDECWYKLDHGVFNFGLRNAIAHNNVHYDCVAQAITYHPGGGRLEKTEGETLSFLEFIHLLLVAFREMHNLHHVIKTLFYYKYLIHDNRDRPVGTISNQPR